MLEKDYFNKLDILQSQELNIEYVSPMALAQRGQELQSIMRGLELFGSWVKQCQLWITLMKMDL